MLIDFQHWYKQEPIKSDLAWSSNQTRTESTWGQLTQMAELILPCAICLINCCANYYKLQSLLLCSTIVGSLSAVRLLQTISCLYLFYGYCAFFSSLSLLSFSPLGLVHVTFFGKEDRIPPISEVAQHSKQSIVGMKQVKCMCRFLSNVCIHVIWTVISLSPLFQLCEDLEGPEILCDSSG